MVASWSRQRHDARWTQLLALSAVRRFWNVTKLVAEPRLTQLAWRHVALLPELAVSVAFVLAQQPQLQSRSFSESLVFTDESILQPDQHRLLADLTALLTDVAELQSDLSELLAELFLLAFIAILQPDEPELPGVQSQLLRRVLLADKSLLADVTELQSDFSVVFADQPELLTFEPELLRSFTSFLSHDAELQSIESQLHANDSDVLAFESELFDAALLAELAVVLAKFDEIQPVESELQSNFAVAVRFAAVHAAKPAELLQPDQSELSGFARPLQSDLQPEKHEIFTDVACIQSNFACVSRGRR